MFLTLLLISFVLLSLAFLGMAIKILVKKKGRFPQYKVGHNSDMAKMGVKCVKHEEIRCHKARLKDKEVFEACTNCQPFD